MDKLLEFLNGFNVQTIVSMGAIVWYFSRDLKKELGDKIDKVEKDIHEMNTRVSRLEGTVYGQDIYKKID